MKEKGGGRFRSVSEKTLRSCRAENKNETREKKEKFVLGMLLMVSRRRRALMCTSQVGKINSSFLFCSQLLLFVNNIALAFRYHDSSAASFGRRASVDGFVACHHLINLAELRPHAPRVQRHSLTPR